MTLITLDSLKKNVPLSKYTTFGIGGSADYLAEPTNLRELKETLDLAEAEGLMVLPLGGGSDILISDKGFRGLVVRFSRMSEVEVKGRKIIVDAGVYLPRLLNIAAKAGLSGLEPLTGIPGQIGGAVAKNAGSYGREIRELVKSVTLLTWDGEFIEIDVQELNLAYRRSRAPEMGIIARVTLELAEGDPETIMKAMEEFTERRRKEQPIGARSAGCIFKNPENAEPAGYLLEQVGLKGYRIGGAAYSTVHANFIINENNASFEDVMKLIELGKKKVKEHFGVTLEEEIVIVPDG